MTLSPVALFAYKRPVHTRRVLESLVANECASKSELFIFCDGPARPEDTEAVKEVRRLVKSRQWCGKVNIIERYKNLGLANSIIIGVTELCDKYGRVIVLEDDLVLSPQFLNYMNDALEIYKEIPKVMHISGYMFPVRGELPETFFYRATSCWGWGTWKRAWDKFESNASELLPKFENKSLQYQFNINGSYDFFNMLKEQAAGKIDSWAIRWQAKVFLEGGFCLHPRASLVNNIGHDGTGVHCGSTEVFDVKISTHRVSNFPSDICENENAIKLMSEFFMSLKKRTLSGRVLDGLLQIINRTI